MLALKLLMRAARHLQAVWLARSGQGRADEHQALDRLAEAQRLLQRARQRFEKARTHNLSLVLPRLRRDVCARVKALGEAAGQAQHVLEQPTPGVPSVPFLLAELRQVEAEFGGLAIDWKRQALSATTEPITLEGVDLGAFAVELFWERLAGRTDERCFDVVALDPNPAAASDRVTHPHVRNGKLCAGDATTPLRQALEQGRLADAFCLIRGVLTYYNASSPHVPLDEWDGRECHDCSSRCDDDDLCGCESCGHDFCDDCTDRCAACDLLRCTGCLDPCVVCGRRCCPRCLRPCGRSHRDCCPRCLQPCAGCGVPVARDELAAATGLCHPCHQHHQPAAGPPTPSIAPSPTPAILPVEDDHAETLGPVAVAAG